MTVKSEKKEYEYIRIISLDGSEFFGGTKPSTFRNGKLNKDFFSGVLDDIIGDEDKIREYNTANLNTPMALTLRRSGKPKKTLSRRYGALWR